MVGIISFYEDLVPLARHRCIESPHPTSCSPIKSCKLRGVDGIPISRTYSLFTLRADDIRPTYFERSETNPSVSAYAEPTPLQGRLNGLCGKSKFIRQLQQLKYCVI